MEGKKKSTPVSIWFYLEQNKTKQETHFGVMKFLVGHCSIDGIYLSLIEKKKKYPKNSENEPSEHSGAGKIHPRESASENLL